MKFIITQATGSSEKPCKNAVMDNEHWVVELNSLDDLMALYDEVDNDLIVGRNAYFKMGGEILENEGLKETITIYNDYIE